MTGPRKGDFDTRMGRGADEFRTTPWSILLQRTVETALPGKRINVVLDLYWRPVYLYIRRRWRKSNEDAKDLAQSFFAHILEKKLLDRADPERGSFRAFLRTSLERFLINQHEADHAQMRGGGMTQRPLTGDLAEDRDFSREWARGLVEDALEELKEQYKGKEVYVRVLERYELVGGATYEEVAKELGISIWDVTNYLVDARRKLRAAIERRIRPYCRTEKEFHDELKELFGSK